MLQYLAHMKRNAETIQPDPSVSQKLTNFDDDKLLYGEDTAAAALLHIA